jgi:hypothetical protein
MQKIAITQLAHLRKAEVLRSNPGPQTGRSSFIVAFLDGSSARARTTVNAVGEIGYDVSILVKGLGRGGKGSGAAAPGSTVEKAAK